MGILSFLSTMTKAFDGERLNHVLIFRELGSVLTGYGQATYKSFVQPGTHEPISLPVTWLLIAQLLLNRFITDYLLRYDQYAVFCE